MAGLEVIDRGLRQKLLPFVINQDYLVKFQKNEYGEGAKPQIFSFRHDDVEEFKTGPLGIIPDSRGK